MVLPDYLTPAIIWFVLSIALFILEIILPGFVSFFFGIGAMMVFVILKFVSPIGLNAQLGYFILFSVLLMLSTRKLLLKRFFAKNDEDTAFKDDFVGYMATATQDSQDGYCKMFFRGTTWNAKVAKPCKEGDKLVIDDIQGNTLIFNNSEKEN